MSVELGTSVEQAIIASAGIGQLNLDPGSMQIDLIGDPMTTVRFTLVVAVPSDAVRSAIAAAVADA
jgi:hypothetical protein